MSQIAQATVSAVVALAMACWVMRLWPDILPAAANSGEKGKRRQEAVQRSGLFRALEPLLRVLAQGVSRWCPVDLRRRAQTTAQQSGFVLGLDGDSLIALSIVTTVLFALGGATTSVWFERGIEAGLILGAIPGAVFPWFKFQDIAKIRFVTIARGLPGVIDLVVLAMESGLDFPGAVHQVTQRLDAKNPLRFELEHLLQKLALGWSRRETLEALAQRVPILPVKQFTTSIIQAEKRGTPLKDVLATQAEVMRTKRSQHAEQAAARAAVLILGPLMLIFACVFAIILGPFVVKYLRGELF